MGIDTADHVLSTDLQLVGFGVVIAESLSEDGIALYNDVIAEGKVAPSKHFAVGEDRAGPSTADRQPGNPAVLRKVPDRPGMPPVWNSLRQTSRAWSGPRSGTADGCRQAVVRRA